MDARTTKGLRIDRWLWYARFFKTRSQAAAAVSGGHVKINGERAKPGSRLLPGDDVRLVRNRMEYDLTVLTLPNRRGPPLEAGQCYSESEASRQRRDAVLESIRQDRRMMPRTSGKPDKHTRRRVRQFNRERRDD